MVQRHVLTLLVALLVSSVAPNVYAQARVAVVDLHRALNGTNDARRAKRRLSQHTKRQKQELDAANELLLELKNEYDKQKAILTRESKAAHEKALADAYNEARTKYVELQRATAEAHEREIQPILDRLRAILAHLGEERGITLILERNVGGVIWIPPDQDLTDELIERYNAEANRPPQFEFTIGNMF